MLHTKIEWLKRMKQHLGIDSKVDLWIWCAPLSESTPRFAFPEAVLVQQVGHNLRPAEKSAGAVPRDRFARVLREHVLSLHSSRSG